MKKILLFVLAFAFSVSAAFSQQNTMEAKAAYLLAEESYGKGDHKSALQYLDEASSKLGGGNAKILYLKIMVLKELAAKDKSFAARMDEAIAEFEKAPDAADFNEEKTLEVVKLKVERKKLRNDEETAKQNVTRADEGIKVFERETGWVMDAPTESVVASHEALFRRHYPKSQNIAAAVKRDGYEMFMKGDLFTIVYFTEGNLTGYYDVTVNEKDTEGFPLAKRKLQELIDKYEKIFGYLPTPEITTLTGQKTTAYTWNSGTRNFSIYGSEISTPGLPPSAIVAIRLFSSAYKTVDYSKQK